MLLTNAVQIVAKIGGMRCLMLESRAWKMKATVIQQTQ